jgi:hypothetical protein
MVPSVTDSPIWGIVICTVEARVAIPRVNCSPPRAPVAWAAPLPGGSAPAWSECRAVLT